MRKAFCCLILFLSVICAGTVNASLLFHDEFEYPVDRNSSGSGEIFTTQGPWSNVKTNQDGRNACGYIYTTNSIPGYSGSLPGKNSNRVLAMEFLPETLHCDVGGGWLQTDCYLTIGSASAPADNIPSNVWFQYWIYLQRYGNQMSIFSDGKWLYPSKSGSYPAPTTTGLDWLVLFKTNSYFPYLESAVNGNTYYELEGSYADNQNVDSWDQFKLGHNITPGGGLIKANEWTLVKIHIDTSGRSNLAPAGQGVYEMWLRNVNGGWRKVTEWIGGVTPGFVWPISNPQGHRALKIGTTVNDHDAWLYMDDFAMASSEGDLPTYGSGGTVTELASPPNNFHIIMN